MALHIFSEADVDKFFDKFEDPAYELPLIEEALSWLYTEAQLHQTTDRILEVRQYFIKKLVMKAYRLGKDHAYAGALDAVRRRIQWK